MNQKIPRTSRRGGRKWGCEEREALIYFENVLAPFYPPTCLPKMITKAEA
jgi:hypothetical protein